MCLARLHLPVSLVFMVQAVVHTEVSIELMEFPHGLTLEEALVKWANVQPDKDLYIYTDDKGHIPKDKPLAVTTFAQFEARTAKLADLMLNSWGLKPGVSYLVFFIFQNWFLPLSLSIASLLLYHPAFQ